MFFFLLSSEKDKTKILRKIFLKVEEAEILRSLSLKCTCLPTLELALESKLYYDLDPSVKVKTYLYIK